MVRVVVDVMIPGNGAIGADDGGQLAIVVRAPLIFGNGRWGDGSRRSRGADSSRSRSSSDDGVQRSVLRVFANRVDGGGVGGTDRMFARVFVVPLRIAVADETVFAVAVLN